MTKLREYHDFSGLKNYLKELSELSGKSKQYIEKIKDIIYRANYDKKLSDRDFSILLDGNIVPTIEKKLGKKVISIQVGTTDNYVGIKDENNKIW